jgi:superfamily II DNA or RNA helicase
MLVDATSFDLPEAKFSSSFTSGFWDGKKKLLTDGNKLPAGLFKSLFPEHPLVTDVYPNYTFDDLPLFVDNPQFERRDYQLDAINTILKNKRGIVAAVVGAGKTLISAATISKHLQNVPLGKVLFVCYDINILGQTLKTFTEYGLDVSQYGNGIKDLNGDVVVATIHSLSRIKQPSKVLKNITMCFCDESHHSASRTSKDVLAHLKNCEYYIGLTATPPKPGTLDLAELMCVLGPVIYEYGFVAATDAGSIAPVKCFFLKTPYSFETKNSVIGRKNYQTIWEGGIKNSQIRNRTIATICSSLQKLIHPPMLIQVDRTEHGSKIGDYCCAHSNLRVLQMYGADNVMIRDMKKDYLMNNDIDLLISTVNGEGIDMKISPVIAFNASGRKSFVKIIQFLGRIVRRNDSFKSFRCYYDYLDECHPKLKEHSEERIQACKDIGATVIICDTVNDLLFETIKYYKECMLSSPPE